MLATLNTLGKCDGPELDLAAASGSGTGPRPTGPSLSLNAISAINAFFENQQIDMSQLCIKLMSIHQYVLERAQADLWYTQVHPK